MRNAMNSRNRKKSLIKINLVTNVWKIGYIEMRDCNL